MGLYSVTMKRLRSILYLFLFYFTIVLFSDCSGSKGTIKVREEKKPEVVDTGYGLALEKDISQSSSTAQQNEKTPSNKSLADMLRGVAGVVVTGQGEFVKVRIGGISSFINSDPLYVLNGTVLGSDYAQVTNSINTNDITSIRVLKNAEAGIYGTRGANGVILIRTR